MFGRGNNMGLLGNKKEVMPETIAETTTENIAETVVVSDTGPLPELDIPDTVFEQTAQPELQESRDYIAILLKDLEEMRQENERLRIPKREKNPWKIFAVVLSLVIVAGLVGFLWFYIFVLIKIAFAKNGLSACFTSFALPHFTLLNIIFPSDHFLTIQSPL